MTATAVALAVIYAYVLWAAFLAVMSLRWAWYRLPIVTRVLAAPLVLLAFAGDLVFNLLASALFFDFPAEATFSQRMGRYKEQQTGWRAAIARWVCANLLDPFQQGGHCRG